MNKKIQNKLSDIQFDVTQNCGTEKPFDNEYWNNKSEGIYVDIIDGTPLFCSLHKYDSGSGWPSFYKPINKPLLRQIIRGFYFGTDKPTDRHRVVLVERTTWPPKR